jgi:protein disulfide-isomerase
MMILAFCAASTFAFAGELNWYTSMEKAKEAARKDNKAILVNFTGSDWCGWCIRLDKEVFTKAAFKDYAEKNLVLLKLDFPKYKSIPADQERANWQLKNKYKIQGFPTILLVDHNEQVLLRTGYKRGGPESYVAHLKENIN